jgi:biotin synthase
MPGSRPEPGAGYLGAVHGPEQLLRERDPSRLEALWSAADDVRRAHVGAEVHLRGLIEISNHCRRQCLYCGLRAGNRDLPRYRMTAGEVVECAVRARGYRCGTVVLQSGEDDGLAAGWVADVIRRIKDATGLAVTLSLGERSREDLAAWRRAGADRYLLRFETSDRGLYEKIHPERPAETRSRLAKLWVNRLLGYEVGSASWSASRGRVTEVFFPTCVFRRARPGHDRHRPVHPAPRRPPGKARAGGRVPATG